MYKNQEFRVSIAPMMDWTDRHCRWFHRRLSRRVRLYTEMVVADAVIHGKRDYLLAFDPSEHPLALQIGGSDPLKLAEAAQIGEDFGYDEININIGCPSDRVQSGRFGACLMQEPELVAECFTAMQAAVDIPVTVKCRLGVDDQRVQDTLPHFIQTVAGAGCKHVIIHARKAWLKGLSPKENRTVPPLDYTLVRDMKVRFPNIEIVLNGGLETLEAAVEATENLDGFMLGRAAYHTPWVLTDIDTRLFGDGSPKPSREDVVADLITYAKAQETSNRTTKALIRHIMGLYAGEVGARIWRRTLSERSAAGDKPSDVIAQAFEAKTAVKSAA